MNWFLFFAGMIIGFVVGIVFIVRLAASPKKEPDESKPNYNSTANWLLELDETELKISE